MTGLNVVTLLGQVTDRGVATHQQDSGVSYATFSVDVQEDGPTGQAFHLWVPVECYGHTLAAAEALHPGDVVAIEGKLKSTSWTDRAGQKHRHLVVLARTVKRLSLLAQGGTEAQQRLFDDDQAGNGCPMASTLPDAINRVIDRQSYGGNVW